MKLTELRDQRASLIAQQEELSNLAAKEDRFLTNEENEKWDRIEKDHGKVVDEIRQLETAEKDHENKLKNLAKNLQDLKKFESRKIEQADDKVEKKQEGSDIAWRKFLMEGRGGLTNTELRALQVDQATKGGYLTAPEQFVNDIIIKLNDEVFMRNYATIYNVPNAQSLGVPALDNDPADPTWTAEIKTGTEDSTMDFDKRALYPHPLAKRIKISEKLVRSTGNGVEGLVRDRFAYRFGIVEENNFLNGGGSNRPLGVFTASAQGINTGQDVSTGNTTTAIKADNLIEVKYKLKAQYRRNARWIFHRDAIKRIRKLKDGNGQYLWRAGIANGAPDTILDIPFDESEYAPNTFTTGLYVGILGDFSFYWIADALDMRMQVLNELYAETAQIGYIARKETDGMPVLEEAFARVKLA